jgi:hypothetical protein
MNLADSGGMPNLDVSTEISVVFAGSREAAGAIVESGHVSLKLV